MAPTDLRRAARLLADDTKSITELIFRYAYLTDHKLHDRVSTEIFCQDAVLQVGSGVFTGRDSIHEYYRQGRNVLAAMMHHYSNVSVDLDGDRARCRSYVTTWMWCHDSANRGSVRPADFADYCERGQSLAGGAAADGRGQRPGSCPGMMRF